MKILVALLLCGCGLVLFNTSINAQKSPNENIISDRNHLLETIKKEIYIDNLCGELFSTSLDIECFVENNATSCDDPMPNGAVAKFKCKHSYHRNSMPYNEIRCDNGNWNQPLFNCEPDCGKKTSHGTPLIIRGGNAEIGEFPWHVGLFYSYESGLSYICGGSIFSPKLVVSAAHCFVQSLEPRDYHVTAGKIYREYNHLNDKHAQFRDLVEIIIPTQYKAEKTGFAADIAILVLDQVFVLSNLVLPVCIDLFSPKLDPIDGMSGKIAGWGLTEENGELSDHLQYATLPLINHDKCLATVPDDFTQHVTLDKICAGYTNGTSVCEGDSGGGLVHERKTDSNETLYYLIGTVSTSPFKEDSCHSFQYTTFTNVDKHMEWINKTKFKYELWTPYDYGCLLPDPPTFGTYVQLDTDSLNTAELKPGDLVPHYTKLRYSCDPGFEIQGQKIITCKEKIWNVNNLFPTCFRMCPKLSSPDMEIKYLYEYTKKPTGESLLHETRALFRCSDSLNYELQFPAYNLTTCRDGRWTKPLLKCVSICGKNDGPVLNPSDDVQIAQEGQYPWHVGVYKNINEEFELQCAGTLISPFVVIIDSNCVDRLILHRYLVIAGVTNSSSYHVNKNIQRSPIFKLIRENQQKVLTFELLILSRRMHLSKFIRPVCLIQPDVRLLPSVIEVPFWVEGDFQLKTKIINEDGNCNPQHLYCAVNVPVTNYTHVNFGRLVRPTVTEKGKRYYLLGYQVEEQEENNVALKITFFRDTTFIQNVIDKYNVRSNVMSECVIPEPPPNSEFNAQLPQTGESVLETTTISYSCKVSEHESYNFSTVFCSDSRWLHLDNYQHGCISCGASKLIDTKRVLPPSGSPYIAVPGEFPWNVALYNTTRNYPFFLCSGTLVTSNIVLTFGKCFTEYMRKKYVNENQYEVVAGTLFSEWNITRNVNAQYAKIHDIIFSGILTPVAVLILDKNFIINNFVAPACLDSRGVISKLVKAPFPIYTSYWSSIEVLKNRRLEFMALNKRFVDGKLVDLVVVNTTHCPDDDYWLYAKGSGSALQVNINGKTQYFIDGVFGFSECASGKLFYRSLRSVMNDILSIISSKSYIT